MRATFGSRMVRRPLAMLLLMALLFTLRAPGPAGAEAASGCLALTGTLKEVNGSVRMFQPIAFEYTIRPEGEMVQKVRDPVEVALVLDVSTSMDSPMLKNKLKPTRLEVLKDASLSFLNELADQKAGDQVGLIKFSTTASQVRGLTTNYNTLKQDVERLTASGYTNIDDGLRKGSQLLATSSGRQKFVILVTDGGATHYGTNGRQNETEAKKQALARADELAKARIPVYTIALGTPGDTYVDHDLLVKISQKTGGQKFEAANLDELKAVFRSITKVIQQQGKITGIEIRQPLPEGFEPADGNPQGTSIKNGALIVPVADIPYPFAVSERKVTVSLKQTRQVGTYAFEDATLAYRDACGRDASAIIPNNSAIHVTGWIDVWGNLYVGDENGAVSRYRHADLNRKQFTIPGSGKPVQHIGFAESSPGANDDAIVHITYEDGSGLTLNLAPKPPAIALKDGSGKPIMSDSGWFSGPADATVSGSGHHLPANTVFEGANGDFQDGYLAGYEYRVLRLRDGSWEPESDWKPADHPFLLDQTGGNIRIEARAATASVSGIATEKTYSGTSSRMVALDDSGPAVDVAVDDEGNPLNTDPIIRITVSDSESPVKRVQVNADGRGKKADGNGSHTVQISMRLSELIPDENERIGWWRIDAAAENEAGLSGAGSAVLVVNPGPDGQLETRVDGKSADTSARAANKPVTVALKNVREIIVAKRADIPESRDIKLSEASYQIAAKRAEPSANAWKKLGALQLQVTREGAHTVWVKLKDSEGNEKILSVDVNINYNQRRY